MNNSQPLLFSGLSSTGKVRTNNEDSFYVNHIWDENTVLAIVADGLGGCEKGEVASKLAVDTIVSYLATYSNGDRLELLRQAVIAANNAIIDNQEEIPDASNMSTVITVSIFDAMAHVVYLAHVGDTRLYQFTHDHGLVKLSHDHTLVGYKEEQGELTELEAMSHPKRNEISKVLGATSVDVNSNKFVELNSFDLSSKSSYLLCSDGLYDMITSSEIGEILDKEENLTDKLNGLIARANDAGGKDNITVVLVENQGMWSNSQSKNSDIDVIEMGEAPYNSKEEIKRKYYFFYLLFLVSGIIIGAMMSFLYEKTYVSKDIIDVPIDTDTIFVEYYPDSVKSIQNKKDSIINKLEEDLVLLKSIMKPKMTKNSTH